MARPNWRPLMMTDTHTETQASQIEFWRKRADQALEHWLPQATTLPEQLHEV